MPIFVQSAFVLPSSSTMTRYFQNLLVVSILLFSGSALCLAGDKWTDSSGAKTVEADFVKLEGIQLTLKNSDGKEIVIPLYKLDSNSRLLARRLAKLPRTPATMDSKATETESVATQSADTSMIRLNNAKQIGLAMMNYENVNKSYPPAYTVDSNGERLHSWRTLLLPYLGHSRIYKKIDLSKPWNHPVNAHLNTKVLTCFAGPAGVQKPGHTQYVVVNDKGGVFFGSKPSRIGEITDGTSNTLLFAETTLDKAVTWMSPQDIDFAEFLESVKANEIHMYVGTADTSVHSIAAQTSEKDLRAFFTKSGGEVIDRDRILERPTPAVTSENSAPTIPKYSGDRTPATTDSTVTDTESVATTSKQNAKESFDTITNSIGMKLVLIPKGTFTMGSPIEEEGRESKEAQHQVTISKDYFLGAFEVTQTQYEMVIGKNPSFRQRDKIKGDSRNHPVENVSWLDAVEFCRRLSELPEEKKAGRVYRLPTEAEWEYACRAGSMKAFSFGESSESLGDYGWHGGNSKLLTHSVGEKNPNAWGVYDMHGNVKEWCSDWHDNYPNDAVADPVGPKDGSSRVIRGGSALQAPVAFRSAHRSLGTPGMRAPIVGFRVALSSFEIPK